MKAKHTPTPWKSNGSCIESDSKIDAMWICHCDSDGSYPPSQDNANRDFIVRAVNSHEKLIEIAKVYCDGITDPMRKTLIGRIISEAEGKS